MFPYELHFRLLMYEGKNHWNQVSITTTPSNMIRLDQQTSNISELLATLKTNLT